MTDNEIIKALELCNDEEWLCPQCKYIGRCKQLQRDALSLINRQKAEIEDLEAEIDKQYEQARADILGNMSDGGTSCHWCIDGHRAIAIKEFAERLKEELYEWVGADNCVSYPRIKRVIDNLVKEMVGDA